MVSTRAMNIFTVGAIDFTYLITCLLTPSFRVPNSGSFIRPSPSISYGRTFLEALSAKYIGVLQTQHHDAVESYVLGSSKGTIEVEAPGIDKVRRKFAQIERLRELSLDGEGVVSAGDEGQIVQMCKSKEETSYSLRSLLMLLSTHLFSYCRRSWTRSVEESHSGLGRGVCNCQATVCSEDPQFEVYY